MDWKQIIIIVLIGMSAFVVALCVWYYFAAYLPVVQHLSKNQGIF